MKRPAVFFDRDNTLIVSDGYLGNPAGVVLVEGAADAVARCRHLGYATVVFSNQSGVGRGLFPEEMVHAVNARLDELLLDHNRGAVIDRHEFCPFHPDATVEAYRADSDLRKPKPGMIYQAAERLAIDLSRSWVIGDAPRDIEAGHSAGCRTILFRDPRLSPSSAATAPSTITPDYVVDSLTAAIAIIEVQTRSDPEFMNDSDADSDFTEPQLSGPDQSSPAPAGSTSAVTSSAPAIPISTAPAFRAAPPVAAERQAATLRLDAGASSAADLSAIVTRLESISQQVLSEIRRHHEQPHTEFSVSKLMAGIVQVIAVAALFIGYLRIGTKDSMVVPLLLAQFLQTLTIALLIMGRQK